VTAALIAAGTTGGTPGESARLWWVDQSRRLAWADADSVPRRLVNPIPGDAVIIACNVWSSAPTAVLGNGEMYQCHANDVRQKWHPQRNLIAFAQNAGGLAHAGFQRASGCWTALLMVTAARRLFFADERFAGPPVAIGSAIPGDARVLAVRLRGGGSAEALVRDGDLLTWGASGWTRSGCFPAGDLILGGCEQKSETMRRWWAVRASDRMLLVADGDASAAPFRQIGGMADVLALRTWNRQVEAILSDGTIT
jgi:hypothetical protein